MVLNRRANRRTGKVPINSIAKSFRLPPQSAQTAGGQDVAQRRASLISALKMVIQFEKGPATGTAAPEWGEPSAQHCQNAGNFLKQRGTVVP
jgi:hypothetical protein